MNLQDHGTVLLSVCQEDLEEALPLVRRFYRLGFNIEATTGTARFLKEQGIRTRVRRDYTEDPADITEAMRSGRVAYLVNTRDCWMCWRPSPAASLPSTPDGSPGGFREERTKVTRFVQNLKIFQAIC